MIINEKISNTLYGYNNKNTNKKSFKKKIIGGIISFIMLMYLVINYTNENIKRVLLTYNTTANAKIVEFRLPNNELVCSKKVRGTPLVDELIAYVNYYEFVYDCVNHLDLPNTDNIHLNYNGDIIRPRPDFSFGQQSINFDIPVTIELPAVFSPEDAQFGYVWPVILESLSIKEALKFISSMYAEKIRISCPCSDENQYFQQMSQCKSHEDIWLFDSITSTKIIQEDVHGLGSPSLSEIQKMDEAKGYFQKFVFGKTRYEVIKHFDKFVGAYHEQLMQICFNKDYSAIMQQMMELYQGNGHQVLNHYLRKMDLEKRWSKTSATAMDWRICERSPNFNWNSNYHPYTEKQIEQYIQNIYKLFETGSLVRGSMIFYRIELRRQNNHGIFDDDVYFGKCLEIGEQVDIPNILSVTAKYGSFGINKFGPGEGSLYIIEIPNGAKAKLLFPGFTVEEYAYQMEALFPPKSKFKLISRFYAYGPNKAYFKECNTIHCSDKIEQYEKFEKIGGRLQYIQG